MEESPQQCAASPSVIAWSDAEILAAKEVDKLKALLRRWLHTDLCGDVDELLEDTKEALDE